MNDNQTNNLGLSDKLNKNFFFKVMLKKNRFEVQKIGRSKETMHSFKSTKRNLKNHVKSLKDKINHLSQKFNYNFPKMIEVKLTVDEILFYMDKDNTHYNKSLIEPLQDCIDQAIEIAANRKVGQLKRLAKIKKRKKMERQKRMIKNEEKIQNRI